jgi:hypothetical protein
MKSFKTGLTHLLVMIALMLPWSASVALETFEKDGVISELGYASFSIHSDRNYRIAPSVKIKIPGKANARLSDLKVGDNIYFKGKTLSGVNYVEFIVFQPMDDQ